jgi:hypothetical protein
MKLTDTQLVLLSSASQRQDGAVETSPKGGAADKVIDKLLRQHLIEEIPAHGGLPVWRRDEDKDTPNNNCYDFAGCRGVIV